MQAGEMVARFQFRRFAGPDDVTTGPVQPDGRFRGAVDQAQHPAPVRVRQRDAGEPRVGIGQVALLRR